MDTVLVILPLADEYQVQSVINECTECIFEIFIESGNIDVHMFLIFVNYAERYNLSQVLSAAPVKGTEFTMLSLKDAGIDKKISTRTRMYIYEEKSKLVESFLESKYFCPDLSSKKNFKHISRTLYMQTMFRPHTKHKARIHMVKISLCLHVCLIYVLNILNTTS